MTLSCSTLTVIFDGVTPKRSPYAVTSEASLGCSDSEREGKSLRTTTSKHLATLYKTDHVTKLMTWDTVCLRSWAGCNRIYYSRSTWRFTHAEPKGWHIGSRGARPKSWHPLSNNLISFKAAKTDYPIFSKYFSIARSQGLAISLRRRFLTGVSVQGQLRSWSCSILLRWSILLEWSSYIFTG